MKIVTGGLINITSWLTTTPDTAGAGMVATQITTILAIAVVRKRMTTIMESLAGMTIVALALAAAGTMMDWIMVDLDVRVVVPTEDGDATKLRINTNKKQKEKNFSILLIYQVFLLA